MALMRAVTCNTAFAHRQLRFRAGVLHSENDEPAAVFAPGSCAPMKNAYLSAICDYRLPGDISENRNADNKVIYLSRRQTKCSQMCWYRAGELHRDHGPAVAGTSYMYDNTMYLIGWDRDRSLDCHWWYMYYHGKPMASDANSFMGDLTELSHQIRSCCGCGRDCVRLVACDVILAVRGSDPPKSCYAFVYRACTGVYLEVPYPGTLIEPCAEDSRTSCTCYKIVGDRWTIYGEGVYRISTRYLWLKRA